MAFMKTVLNPADDLQYQDNAIVSKTLITNAEKSITLFAFDKGQSINTHTAPVDAAVYVLDGHVEIIISDEKFELSTGEMVIMPAGEPHALTALTQFKMMLVKI